MNAPSKATQAPAGSQRMTLANVVRGKQDRPLRVIAYGVEGVGKSTFGAQAPGAVFLCAEDGTAHLDVARFPTPRTWADVLEAVRVLTYEEHEFKTLVIDTLDWLEPLCWQHVCFTNGKQSVEDFGYGKGYVLAVEQWRVLLRKLDDLVRTRRMHVVLLAHAAVRRVDDPQTGPFDRYRMKVHEKSADVLREWVDAILFARHEVRTIERNGKMRGVSSGVRVLHTTWTAAYDAKNRFDLPDTLPLAWDDFETACRAHRPGDPAKLRAEIGELIPQLPEQYRAAAEQHLAKVGNDAAKLAHLLDRTRSRIALGADTADPPEASRG
jgi:hypothetical protein